jgi:hypothetical protein
MRHVHQNWVVVPFEKSFRGNSLRAAIGQESHHQSNNKSSERPGDSYRNNDKLAETGSVVSQPRAKDRAENATEDRRAND